MTMYQTGEIHEVMAFFERTMGSTPGLPPLNFEREQKGVSSGIWDNRAFYCNGETNQIFLAFLTGHAHGRSYERDVT